MNKYRTHNCNELRKEDVGKKVVLSGWVNKKRDHGNLLFVDLRDNYGITQFIVEKENKSFSDLEKIQLETVIKIQGKVISRSDETINPDIQTGEIEVVIEKFEILGVYAMIDDGEIDCREAVRASAKIVLLIITTAWLFMGLGLTVVGIMAISNFGQYSGLVEAEVLYVVVIVGIVMMLVTIIGYCGIFKLKKILLIIYKIPLLTCEEMLLHGYSCYCSAS